MQSRCSVTIVGAGPSGTAAAACLAADGIAVTLIDQHDFPRDKTCGDGLIPDALSALRELGMLEEVRKHAIAVSSLRLYAPQRHSVAVGGELACVPRETLDRLLLDNALAEEMACFAISLEQAICPGYGWIFAGPDNVFNVGVGLFYDSKRKLPTDNLRTLWRLFLEEFEPARRLNAVSKQLTPEHGAPLRTGLGGARFARPGLFVVGEAAGTTYSFSGEGIGKALQSGMLASRCIAEGPRNGEPPEVRYERSLVEQFAALYKGYKTAQDWLSSPAICNFITRRAQKGRYAKQKLEEVLAETTDPRAIFSVPGMIKAALM